MKHRTSFQQQRGHHRSVLWLLLVIGLGACTPALGFAPTPSHTDEIVPFPTLETAPPALTPSSPEATSLPSPSPAIIPTHSPSPTLEPPPPAFSTRLLLRGVQPQTYLETCEYLRQRWDPQAAQPGTIVVPIMYHSVRTSGRPIRDNITVSEDYFKATLRRARELGFETITVAQLADFLHHNTYIPPRSLLLIVDDRSQGTVRSHFLPILQDYGWTVTMAYITGVGNEREWQEIRDLVATGHVDVQAHGFLHNAETYFTETTPEDILHQEIEGPIQALESHLGQRPLAYIWPGGNFTSRAVQIARAAGYQLGFTAYSRGPLMFNWIPLGEPERAINDPLMVLPRYWGTAALVNLEQAVAIAEQAQAFAESQRAEEMRWYRQNCRVEPTPPPE